MLTAAIPADLDLASGLGCIRVCGEGYGQRGAEEGDRGEVRDRGGKRGDAISAARHGRQGPEICAVMIRAA